MRGWSLTTGSRHRAGVLAAVVSLGAVRSEVPARRLSRGRSGQVAGGWLWVETGTWRVRGEVARPCSVTHITLMTAPPPSNVIMDIFPLAGTPGLDEAPVVVFPCGSGERAERCVASGTRFDEREINKKGKRLPFVVPGTRPAGGRGLGRPDAGQPGAV